jgi:hypothetical protein
MGNSQYEQISLLGIPTIKILVAYQYPPNMIQKLDGRTSDTTYVKGKSHQKWDKNMSQMDWEKNCVCPMKYFVSLSQPQHLSQNIMGIPRKSYLLG